MNWSMGEQKLAYPCCGKLLYITKAQSAKAIYNVDESSKYDYNWNKRTTEDSILCHSIYSIHNYSE